MHQSPKNGDSAEYKEANQFVRTILWRKKKKHMEYDLKNLTEQQFENFIEHLKANYKDLEFDLEDSNSAKHPVVKSYMKLFELKNDPLKFYTQLFYDHTEPFYWLDEIRKHNYQDFNYYKHRLFSSQADYLSYNGDKVECFNYFQLLQKNILFTRTEHPDFTITLGSNNKIGVECGTCQFDPRTEVSDKEKITQKIKRSLNIKLNKPYANLSTALFFDLRNIGYHLNKIEIEKEEIFDYLNSYLNSKEKSSFGAILIFFYDVHVDESGLRTHAYWHKTIHHKDCDNEVIEFIKKYQMNKPKSIKYVIRLPY